MATRQARMEMAGYKLQVEKKVTQPEKASRNEWNRMEAYFCLG